MSRETSVEFAYRLLSAASFMVCCSVAFGSVSSFLQVLENVKEMWTEIPKAGKGKKKTKPVSAITYNVSDSEPIVSDSEQ